MRAAGRKAFDARDAARTVAHHRTRQPAARQSPRRAVQGNHGPGSSSSRSRQATTARDLVDRQRQTGGHAHRRFDQLLPFPRPPAASNGTPVFLTFSLRQPNDDPFHLQHLCVGWSPSSETGRYRHMRALILCCLLARRAGRRGSRGPGRPSTEGIVVGNWTGNKTHGDDVLFVINWDQRRSPA